LFFLGFVATQLEKKEKGTQNGDIKIDQADFRLNVEGKMDTFLKDCNLR